MTTFQGSAEEYLKEQIALRLGASSAEVTSRRWVHHYRLEWSLVNSLIRLMAFQQTAATAQPAYDPSVDGLDPFMPLWSAEMDVENAFARCRSPIEELFLAYLITAGEVAGEGLSWPNEKPPAFLFSFLLSSTPEAKWIGVSCNAPIGPYKADFLLKTADDRHKLVVELDGHDFHERTKQQAAHDKSRDRKMLASGFHVMRFTGSEVWGDPKKCVLECLRFLAAAEGVRLGEWR